MATSILASEALFAYLIFPLKLVEIYVPFADVTEAAWRKYALPTRVFDSSANRPFVNDCDANPKNALPTLDIHRTTMYHPCMKLTKDLVAASTVPLILAILEEGENYGYALIQRTRELSGGAIEWTDGMLYPVLHRLEAQGYVRARWAEAETGRKRRYYALTAARRKVLRGQKEQWQVVQMTLDKLWGLQHG